MQSSTPIIRVPAIGARASASALPQLLERVEFETRSGAASPGGMPLEISQVPPPSASNNDSIRLIRLHL